jgi:hypothetical protein
VILNPIPDEVVVPHDSGRPDFFLPAQSHGSTRADFRQRLEQVIAMMFYLNG